MYNCTHCCKIESSTHLLSAVKGGPAMQAFQQFYSKLLYELQPWVMPITTACNKLGLIPDDVTRGNMRSDERVTRMLDAVQTSISRDYRSLRRFVRVLKEQRASVELLGDSLHNLYRKCHQ